MRILTRKEVARAAASLAQIHMLILAQGGTIPGKTMEQITAGIRDAAEAIGGEAGTGMYANKMMDYYMG